MNEYITLSLFRSKVIWVVSSEHLFCKVLLWTHVSFWGLGGDKYLRLRLLACGVGPLFPFIETAEQRSEVVQLYAQAMIEGPRSASPLFGGTSHFHVATLLGVKRQLTDSVCVSLMTNGVEQLFVALFVVDAAPLVARLLRSFARLFYWVVFFYRSHVCSR